MTKDAFDKFNKFVSSVEECVDSCALENWIALSLTRKETEELIPILKDVQQFIKDLDIEDLA